uniref:Uncharacterized protein n=1 Tax=Calcidiscus leptoporus TaxID=127549 RepID=A0A7S0IT24_9EUKA
MPCRLARAAKAKRRECRCACPLAHERLATDNSAKKCLGISHCLSPSLSVYCCFRCCCLLLTSLILLLLLQQQLLLLLLLLHLHLHLLLPLLLLLLLLPLPLPLPLQRGEVICCHRLPNVSLRL